MFFVRHSLLQELAFSKCFKLARTSEGVTRGGKVLNFDNTLWTEFTSIESYRWISHCSLSKSFPVRVFNILFVRLQTSNYQNRGALRDSHLSDAFRFPRWRRPARMLYHALTTAMMSVWSQDEKRVSFEYLESWEVASDSNSIQIISIIDACAASGLKYLAYYGC